MILINRKYALYVWLSMEAVGACNSPGADTAVAPVPSNSTLSKQRTAASDDNHLLKDIKTTHRFSSAATTDQFRLQLRGASVLDGTVHFSIVSAAGDTLWKEKFPATALYTDEAPSTTEISQEAYILQRFDSFFVNENFLIRAIPQEAAFDAELNGNRQLWAETKKQAAPGFAYLLGDEDGRVLAYSTRLNKVVMVENCC